jgi:hypothetical protein
MKRKNVIALLAIASVAVLALSSPAWADGVQLFTNPGFEDSGGSFNGWTTFGAFALSTPGDDDIYRSGTAAAKVYGIGTACPIPVFDVSGVFQSSTTLTVGKEFEFSGYSFVSEADTIPGNDTCVSNRAIAKIVFFDAATNGAEISSNEIIIGDWATPRGTWIPFSVSALVPPGALRVQAMILFLQPGCDTGAVFVDDLFFCENTPTSDDNDLANPSFDTDLSGWNTFGNVFYENRSFGVRTPTGSAKLFGTFSEGNDSGMYQRLDTDPATNWKLSVYALNTCQEDGIRGKNTDVALARIVFRDNGGNDLGGQDVIIGDNSTPLGTWTRYEVTATAPAGTDSVDAYILFTQGPLLENGAIFVDDVAFAEDVSSGVGDTPAAIGAELYQNVPNPFNPTTQISFSLTRRENVDVSIYDVKGRIVNTLFEGSLDAGPHSLTWDGTAVGGARVASGIYLYVLRTSAGQLARRMVMLK